MADVSRTGLMAAQKRGWVAERVVEGDVRRVGHGGTSDPGSGAWVRSRPFMSFIGRLKTSLTGRAAWTTN